MKYEVYTHFGEPWYAQYAGQDMRRSNDIKNPFAIDVGCNSVLVELLSDIWFLSTAVTFMLQQLSPLHLKWQKMLTELLNEHVR